jgi:CBS domain-containing protein
MTLRAKDLMKTEVVHVTPSMTLVELDRVLLEKKISGATVVDRGKLVGVVSRSDILKRLSVEQSVGEMITDFYSDFSWPQEDDSTGTAARVEDIGEFVGERFETLTVRDIMSHKLVTVDVETPIDEVARVMIRHRLHRVLATEGDAVAGIVTSTDFVRAIAEKSLKPVSE